MRGVCCRLPGRFAIGLVIGLLTCTAAPAAAWPGVERLPDGPEAVTDLDHRRREDAWFRQVVLEGYRQHGSRNPAWDGQLKSFYEQLCRHYAFSAAHDSVRPAGVPTTHDLRAPADAIKKLGCDDPYFAYAWANMHRADGIDLADFARAYNGLEHTDYHPALKFFAAKRTLEYAQNANVRLHAAQAMGRHMFEAFAGADPADRDAMQIMVRKVYIDGVHTLRDEQRLAAMAVFDGMVNAQNAPELDPWAVGIIRGGEAIKESWRLRGRGTAGNVTAEGWRGFRRQLDVATKHLNGAWRADPARPEAAGLMIVVAMGQSDATAMHTWFMRAVEAQLDYWPAYNNVLWGLRPRWLGSHEEMLAFGRACLATERFDTRVPGVFIDALHQIADDFGGDHSFIRSEGLAADFERYYSGALKALPEGADWSSDRALRRSYWQAFSYLAGDFERVAVLDDQLGDEPNEAALHRLILLQNNPIGEARARLSPQAEGLEAAEALEEAGELVTAAVALETAASQLPPGAVRDYLDWRAYRNRKWTAMLGGGWVDVTPPVFDGQPDLTGWITRGGQWSGDDDGVVVRPDGKDGFALLLLQLPMPEAFELAVTFSPLKEHEQPPTLAVVPAYRDWLSGFYHAWSVGDRYIYTTRLDGTGRYTHLTPGDRDRAITELTLALRGSQISTTFNGRPVHNPRSLGGAVRAGRGLVGIGLAPAPQQQDGIRIHSVRIRMLPH